MCSVTSINDQNRANTPHFTPLNQKVKIPQ